MHVLLDDLGDPCTACLHKGKFADTGVILGVHVFMKILITGKGIHSFYEKAFYLAFRKLGLNTLSFYWLEGRCTNNIFFKFQNKYLLGPMIQDINKKFIYKAINFQPDLIFIYRGTHILPGTLKKIREQLKAFIFAYNNDDPFSHKHPKYLWRHYLKSLDNQLIEESPIHLKIWF